MRSRFNKLITTSPSLSRYKRTPVISIKREQWPADLTGTDLAMTLAEAQAYILIIKEALQQVEASLAQAERVSCSTGRLLGLVVALV